MSVVSKFILVGLLAERHRSFVKVWSIDGVQLMATLAHPPAETDSFVYGICVLPSGEVISVGEDSFARVIAQGLYDWSGLYPDIC